MKTISCFMMAVALSFSLGSWGHAIEMFDLFPRDQEEEIPLNYVTGTVKAIDGNYCVVQDQTGMEWNIRLDTYTDTTGHIVPGATISATVDPNGQAMEVRVLRNS
jgi:hypothetical protein